MQIVVLVKYVPEPLGTPTLGDDFLLVREGAEGALDPGDEYAVEAALQLVGANGGEVTLVSMGPEVAMSAIRKALSMGAHQGILVSDPSLRGADALVTATGSAADPRYPTLKGIMSAKQKPVDQVAIGDLGLAADDLKPSQRVTAATPAPEKGPGEILQAGDDAYAKVADLLADAKVI